MKIHTYLHFDGDCELAMNFYKDVLGGNFSTFMRFEDAPNEVYESPEAVKKLIMHCTLETEGGALIMASDYVHDKIPLQKGNNISVSININEEVEALRVFNGLAKEGTIVMNFDSVFWGGKFGMLIDKFGIHWMVSSEHKTT